MADPRIAPAALEGLRDGVLVVSAGEVVVANRAAHRLTGSGVLVGAPAPASVATAAARGGAVEVALPGGDGRRRRGRDARRRRAAARDDARPARTGRTSRRCRATPRSPRSTA